MTDRYGPHHRRLRAYWQTQINAGRNPICSRCPYPVTKGDRWDLDHEDDGIHYKGPAHQDCNRRAGAHRRHQLHPKHKTTTPRGSRNW